MRNKILYVLTEPNEFFYLLNKELNRLRVKFEVLNFNAKIPNIPCILVTTEDKYEKIKSRISKKVLTIVYSKNENFNRFIVKILTSYRIGKSNFSDLTFSIDPGAKHLGLVIFLDDYFLNSCTIYEKGELIKVIKEHVDALQENITELLSLNFKLGRGVQSICMDLVENIYEVFKDRKNLKIQLIDESKSSRIKIHENKGRFPKHEASALILSFRDGVEIKMNNFERKIYQINENNNLKVINNIKILEEIAEKVINGELSLSKTTEKLKSEALQH